MRALGWCALCLCAACGAAGEPFATRGADSGVSGSVTLSPAHPGPQRRGEADTAPYGGAQIELRDARGRVIASGTTDAAGRFRIAAPPGRYEVGVQIRNSILPRCNSVQAGVQPHRMADVAIACDSGLR